MSPKPKTIADLNSKKAAEIIGDQLFDATGRAAFDFDDYQENPSLGLMLGAYHNLALALDNNDKNLHSLDKLLDLSKKEFQGLIRDIQSHLTQVPDQLSAAKGGKFIERLAKDIHEIGKLGNSAHVEIEITDIYDDMSSFLTVLLTSEEVGFNEVTRKIGLSLGDSLQEIDGNKELTSSYELLAEQLLSANKK
jgi:hypothetical protein